MKITLDKKTNSSQIIINRVIGLLDEYKITYKISEQEKSGELSILFCSPKKQKKEFMVVPLVNKGFMKIDLQDIRYITTKGRNTVIQLSDSKIETKYSISHWQNTLDQTIFAIPHNSYIVNLIYVVEISRELIKINDGKNSYVIYPSQRKYCSFKRAFINFKKD